MRPRPAYEGHLSISGVSNRLTVPNQVIPLRCARLGVFPLIGPLHRNMTLSHMLANAMEKSTCNSQFPPTNNIIPRFGSTGRFGHDSTTFYAGRLYDGLRPEKAVPYVENPVPADTLDTVIRGSSERMAELPDNSVHLMVTSPPYNVGKDYDEDLTLEEYTGFLKRVMSEVHRALVPGGRACVNVANLGRRPYLPLHSLIIQDMIEVGFLMRGEVIWDKGGSAGRSTAWGSWLSPSNPTLRDVHEYILIFCKDTFSRPQVEGRAATITRDQFLEYTKSLWIFPSESAAKVGHPAPFPVELPHRCVQLYSYEGEVVLDPFMGSGSTAVACEHGAAPLRGL